VSLPVLGRMFGVHTDNRSQTEVVLLITPRVLRNLPLPGPSLTRRPGGTAADPGAQPLRLSARAQAAVPSAAGAATAAAGGEAGADAAAPASALRLSSGGRVMPGGTVSVTLRNPTELRISGELEFDPALLANAAAGAPAGPRAPFDLAPGADFVLVLRALPAATPGLDTQVTVTSLAATARDGSAALAEVSGQASIQVVPDAR
jgi:general secretion pathway protein D